MSLPTGAQCRQTGNEKDPEMRYRLLTRFHAGIARIVLACSWLWPQAALRFGLSVPGILCLSSALQNTYAHIERPLGVDLIRAECTLRPESAVSWVSSLFFY